VFHVWCLVRLTRSGLIGIFSHSLPANDWIDNWISGLAFGKNLWNNAVQNAYGYLYNYNAPDGFNSGLTYKVLNFDQQVSFNGLANTTIYVPIAPSSNHKLLYAIEQSYNIMTIFTRMFMSKINL
jgi:hypothetical protein